jgi:hypothetical protein
MWNSTHATVRSPWCRIEDPGSTFQALCYSTAPTLPLPLPLFSFLMCLIGCLIPFFSFLPLVQALNDCHEAERSRLCASIEREREQADLDIAQLRKEGVSQLQTAEAEWKVKSGKTTS